MGKKIKNASFWLRRRSYLPVFIIGAVVVALLYLNEETSVTLNMKYEREIRDLNEEIALNRDSAEWYRAKREAILTGQNELEHIAREQYHMQKPTEDVFLITDHK